MWLIRHGQSEFNAAFTLTRVDPGIPDPALTVTGRSQAAEAAASLRGSPVRRLIASPYRRTLETASIIAAVLDLPIELDLRVRERAAFHCDIGTSPAALRRDFPALDFDTLDEVWWHDHMALGVAETEHQLDTRARSFVADLERRTDRNEVAVVTHWGFIRAMTGESVHNAAILHRPFA
jgi:broad specificity phosphatase PhoE